MAAFSSVFSRNPRTPIDAKSKSKHDQQGDSVPAEPTAVGPALIVAGDRLSVVLGHLAEVAGVPVQFATRAEEARDRWSSAGLVIIEGQVLRASHELPARRAGVVIVVDGKVDAADWQLAVEVGAIDVLALPQEQDLVVSHLVNAASLTDGLCPLVGVIGGRGGAGATVVAAGLGITAAQQGLDVGVVDLDALGGGIDLVFGAEGMAGPRWSDLVDARGRISPAALKQALPNPLGVSMLACDRIDYRLPEAAVTSVIDALRRAHDLVVVDLPRADLEHYSTTLRMCTHVLVVIPKEVGATTAAQVLTTRLARLTREAAVLSVVVRGPSPGGLTTNDVLTCVGLPLAVEMSAEPAIAGCLERGEPPASSRGPLQQACRQLLCLLLERQVAA